MDREDIAEGTGTDIEVVALFGDTAVGIRMLVEAPMASTVSVTVTVTGVGVCGAAISWYRWNSWLLSAVVPGLRGTASAGHGLARRRSPRKKR